MPSPLHVLSHRSLTVLALLVSAFAFSNTAAAAGANPQSSVTVSDDSLKVYSDATAESSLVTTLTKSSPVTVRLRISNSEGAWCKIEMKPQQDQVNAGFVHCSGLSGNLQPQPKNPEAAPTSDAGSSQTSPSANLGFRDDINHCVDAPIPPKLQASGQIYLVPIGGFPPVALDYLRDCYARRFGLDLRVLPPIPIDPSAANDQRQQLIAEPLIAELNRRYANLASRPDVVLIGFVMPDMYGLDEPSWKFEFGQTSGRSGVISTARFIIGYGQRADGNLIITRIRKMTGRYLGRLYYGLPANSNPTSLMYSELLGLEELDAMSEDF